MKKGIFAGIISLFAVIAIAGIVYANRAEKDPLVTDNSVMKTTSIESHDDSESHDSNTDQKSASTQNSESSDVQSGTVAMDIKDYEFSKKTLKIKKGTTVTWTNQDTAKHDVNPENPSAAFQPSELLAKGESYSFKFDTVGTYNYICSPHPYMKASIEVVE